MNPTNPIEELANRVDSLLKSRELLTARDLEILEQVKFDLESLVASNLSSSPERRKGLGIRVVSRILKLLLDSDLLDQILNP